jgi:hypothetical protein
MLGENLSVEYCLMIMSLKHFGNIRGRRSATADYLGILQKVQRGELDP